MIARIEMIPGYDEYVVFKEEDCRDEADLSAYRAAKMMGESIVQGKINVTPLKRVDIIRELINNDMENMDLKALLRWYHSYIYNAFRNMSDDQLQAEYEERFK